MISYSLGSLGWPQTHSSFPSCLILPNAGITGEGHCTWFCFCLMFKVRVQLHSFASNYLVSLMPFALRLSFSHWMVLAPLSRLFDHILRVLIDSEWCSVCTTFYIQVSSCFNSNFVCNKLQKELYSFSRLFWVLITYES